MFQNDSGGDIYNKFIQSHLDHPYNQRRLQKLREQDLDSKYLKKEREHTKFHIFRGFLVRFVFVAVCTIEIYLFVKLFSFYWLFLLIVPVIILAEGIYVALKRNGVEFSWYFEK